MSEQAIRAALESRLKAWADAQPIKVAYQNKAFTPPKDANYLRAFLLPAATVSNDVEGKHREWRGIFQISAYCLPDKGPGAASRIAAAMDELFPVNLALLSQGIEVRIIRPASAGPAEESPTVYQVPISIGYHAQIYLL